jgi:hypothetical protein
MFADTGIEIESAAAVSGPHMVETQIRKLREYPQEPAMQPLRHDTEVLVAAAGEATEDDA